MKEILFQYKYQLLLLLIGLFWFELFNFITQIENQNINYPDAKSYAFSAKAFYILHIGHETRPLLMAIITGIPYLFNFGEQSIYTFSFYVNLFCWLSFLLIIFTLLKDFLKPKKAFIFTLICIFIIGNLASIFYISTENIYMSFILLGFYFLIKYFKTKQYFFLTFALSLFILSMLIKPGSKFLAIIFTLYFIKEIYKNYISKFSYLIYGSFLFVLIQCAGLKYQFGNFTISNIDVITYYAYLGAKSDALEKNEDFKKIWLSRTNEIYSLKSPEKKKLAVSDLTNQLQHNSSNLIKAYFLNLFENATTGDINTNDCKNVKQTNYFNYLKELFYEITKWQNVIFSVIGYFLSVYFLLIGLAKKTEIQYAFIAFFILYIFLTSGISCSEGNRFNVITFPFIILLLGKFIQEKTALISNENTFS